MKIHHKNVSNINYMVPLHVCCVSVCVEEGTRRNSQSFGYRFHSFYVEMYSQIFSIYTHHSPFHPLLFTSLSITRQKIVSVLTSIYSLYTYLCLLCMLLFLLVESHEKTHTYMLYILALFMYSGGLLKKCMQWRVIVWLLTEDREH